MSLYHCKVKKHPGIPNPPKKKYIYIIIIITRNEFVTNKHWGFGFVVNVELL